MGILPLGPLPQHSPSVVTLAALKTHYTKLHRPLRGLQDGIWGPCPTCSANRFRGPAFLGPPATSLTAQVVTGPTCAQQRMAWLVPIYIQQPSISTTFLSFIIAATNIKAPSLFATSCIYTNTPHLLVQISINYQSKPKHKHIAHLPAT